MTDLYMHLSITELQPHTWRSICYLTELNIFHENNCDLAILKPLTTLSTPCNKKTNTILDVRISGELILKSITKTFIIKAKKNLIAQDL